MFGEFMQAEGGVGLTTAWPKRGEQIGRGHLGKILLQVGWTFKKVSGDLQVVEGLPP